MFKRIKQQILFGAEIVEAAKDIFNSDARTLEYKGYDLIYSKNLLRKSRALVAGITTADEIIVDDVFLDISDNAKQFAILHELGHKYYKHNKTALTDKERDINEELLADSFALSQGMTSLDIACALVELYEITLERTGVKCKEIKIRALHFVKQLNNSDKELFNKAIRF